mgnify:CR=1 FL=1
MCKVLTKSLAIVFLCTKFRKKTLGIEMQEKLPSACNLLFIRKNARALQRVFGRN